MTIPEKIKAIRKAIRMSQREFAEEVGCHQTMISSYESGARNPALAAMNAIDAVAKKYKVKIRLLRN